jgi:hypothetical protein
VSALPSSASTLVKDGKSSYSIVIAADAVAPEKNAAEELQKYLLEVTGVKLPIVTENEKTPGACRILLGQSKAVKNLLPDTDWKGLGFDGIIIKSVGDDLVISGGRPRGTLYAVYTFLEDIVGCRWWTSTESFIPKKPTLEIGKQNIRYVPKLQYREAFYRETNSNPLFSLKLKLNGVNQQVPADYGGHYDIIGWCHTFYRLIPPDKYFKDHPEWFSELEGKRTTRISQLCLTNEEMRKELVKNALELIKANPTAGIISISQNDGEGQCQCEKCRAVEAEEGSPSGPLIRFVNAVAEDIEKEYPDFLVETLAYTYSRKPPLKVKPRHNVMVRLCSIECRFTKPLNSEDNKSFRDDVDGWKKAGANLYVWDYVTNFSNCIFPHPNMRVLAPNIRYLTDSGAIGIFQQGDASSTVGDFVKPRAWVISHLLWNPSLDEKKLMAEFINGYYGAAAPYISAYLDLIHNSAERDNALLGCYYEDADFLKLDVMNKATELFDQAERAASGDLELIKRVRRDRLPLDHTWLVRYNDLKKESQSKKLPFLGPKDPFKASEDYIHRIKSWKNEYYSEGMPFATYAPSLQIRFAPAPPTPAEIDKMPKDRCVQVQEDAFQLDNVGTWSNFVDDPTASNGKAAFMPGIHVQRAVKYYVSEELAKKCPGKWHAYAILRCPTTAAVDWAFYYGVFDQKINRDAVVLFRKLDSANDDGYYTLYMGDYELDTGMHFWFQPNGWSKTVKGLYVDRLVFVKE